MDLNQYEQSLIKCEYIRTVCDELLKQLDTKALSKVLNRTKLTNVSQNSREETKYDRIEAEYKEQAEKDNKEYQTKMKSLQQQIKHNEQHLKKLKTQILELKQSRYEGVKHTRINIRKIKQASQLEMQSVQLRKLLNYELQNLNTLQTSNIEVNQAIEQYQKKQVQLKNKIKKVMEKQNQYFRCRDLQEKYQTLLLNKRKLVEQNNLFDQNKHSQLINKITAIAQANENLTEMDRYEKDLALMIKEKLFIIEEIQNREEVKKQKDKLIEEEDDDSEIFQNQINNLRKTIANRKFLQRAKNLHNSNKLEDFLNNSTPKNTLHYSKTDQEINNSKRKSIFKIQIEPISHLNSINHNDVKNQKIEREHRNSLPVQIGKTSFAKNPPKNTSNLPKQFFSQNKLKNLDTIEVETLQKIIRKKQSQLKQAQHSPIFELEESPQNQKKINQPNIFARNSQPNKKIILTEPVQFKDKKSFTSLNKVLNDSSVTPNSRFIEQIIESNSGEYMQRLKNMVRIRTKKSETEKYKYLEQRQNLKKAQKRTNNSDLRSPNFSSSKTVPSSISHSNDITPKNYTKKDNNQKRNKNFSFDTAYDNEFMGIDMRQETASQQKEYKLKYKDKISSLSEIKSSVDNVLNRINLLKNQKEKSDEKEKKVDQIEHQNEKKEPKKDKVKIFKLSSRRKYGNVLGFQRKGKAQEMEDFESEEENKELPKIQEEDESIRNTLQSIAQT